MYHKTGKGYKKKQGGGKYHAGKGSHGLVDYMNDMPLAFDLDEINQHLNSVNQSKQPSKVTVKQNSFTANNSAKIATKVSSNLDQKDLKKQYSNLS